MPARRSVSIVAFLALVTLLLPTTLSGAASKSATTSQKDFSPRMLTRVDSSPMIYVLGYASCQHARCLQLLRTDDNGTHFREVSAPPTTALKGSEAGTLEQMVFANAQDGYALEGSKSATSPYATTLYATFDGARTWQQVHTPEGGADFSRIAVSSNTLYGVVMHCAKQPNGNEGCTNYQLDHASLSVKHWTSSPIPNGRSYPWGFLGNIAAYKSKVWFTEGAKWSLLVSSLDKGTTFTSHTPAVPALMSVAGCDLTAVSSTTLWAACPTGMEVSFFFSSDAGVKWATLPTKQFMGTGGGFFDPLSTTLAYLDYGQASPLYRVSDAGRNMKVAGKLDCSNVASLVFTNVHDGLALYATEGDWSSARLERTVDGGATWHRATL
jgi:hypothetical protein